jgi:uncharacterized phiE125 gp8 family phage protein
MISTLLTGPAGEPLALAEMKQALRLDGDAEDALVARLIIAARLHVTAVTGRALITETWRLALDGVPRDRVVRLPVSPLVAVMALRTLDDDGNATDWPVTGLVLAKSPALIVLPEALVGAERRAQLGIEIDYEAGYSDADAVPADLKQAMALLVGHWFEHREAGVVDVTAAALPLGVAALLAPYRELRL